jgi:hypothetical protein
MTIKGTIEGIGVDKVRLYGSRLFHRPKCAAR